MGNLFEILTAASLREYTRMTQIQNWIIEHKRDVLIFALIFLVSSISFALGFLMAREAGRAPIVIEQTAE